MVVAVPLLAAPSPGAERPTVAGGQGSARAIRIPAASREPPAPTAGERENDISPFIVKVGFCGAQQAYTSNNTLLYTI
jgi:hypothetical protein